MTKRDDTHPADQRVLSYYAEGGAYYDSVDDIPDDILISTVRAQERVMADPASFPNADLASIEAAWPALSAVAAGRLLLID